LSTSVHIPRHLVWHQGPQYCQWCAGHLAGANHSRPPGQRRRMRQGVPRRKWLGANPPGWPGGAIRTDSN
jgi:hypothetical protein